MQIKNMFRDDINRTINGVIQVEQEQIDVVEQEIKEYVVTTELKKHFTKFFDSYSESFDKPTDNVGVWITGFFGSGKSHFLKMLSYLLENKDIKGRKTVDYFEEKFNDQLAFMNIQKSTQVPTETILFNIDVEGSMTKDDTAVLRVFAKVFYNHIGFYGKDLKLAKLEQFITKQGKMDEFKEVFEEINMCSWEESRDTYNFFEDDIVEALVRVLGMSETSARHWFDGTETADISIADLVDEIKDYVDSKGKNFRLLFMIDEAGQYMSTNTSMLLNLQSLIEKLGSVCRGQVWIVATGQEALDDMIKVRQNEFSRIMARFNIRLSLTSSSVGEVIEKRLLTKTDEAKKTLESVYENNESVLKNLYSFDTDVKDIKGYSSQKVFEAVFPFVPYQFIIMQKVFNETRLHGHAGKHQSHGERSMLNGFQESAQKVQNSNELTLVPLFTFYDTLHSFLDTSVRSVIERAERAANNGDGLTLEDVNLLKLLYLVRYIDNDIKSNIENLTILMADKITVDKLILREEVKQSLARLQKQNYITRNGDVYLFLTDEEQDIEREINNTVVDTASVVSKISEVIFDDIYTSKKFKYKKYDFPFDAAVDNQNHGNTTGGMKLRFMTVAADDVQDLKLIADSKGNESICVLSKEYSYFEDLEKAMKIRKYIKQKNVAQLPEPIQKIITAKQTEASRLERESKEEISKAIVAGKYYIDGEVVSLTGTTAKAVIDKALVYLVEHTYSALNQITNNVESDADIRKILTGAIIEFDGMESNTAACDTVYSYLDKQSQLRITTSMSDIQSRYQSVPYGWREIDVAAVVAKLIYQQKVTIKHSGQTIQPADQRLIDYLRKKTEIGYTTIARREIYSPTKLNQLRGLLREYFDKLDVPSDEDGLVQFIVKGFGDERIALTNMKAMNNDRVHPGLNEVQDVLRMIENILLSQNDNIALFDSVLNKYEDLLDSKDAMKDVENFYKSQITLYDNALRLKHSVETDEKDYLLSIDEVKSEIEKIADITKVVSNYKYNRIPQLNDCISNITTIRSQLVSDKKKEVFTLIDQCVDEIELKANGNAALLTELTAGKQALATKKEETNRIDSLPLLDAKKNTITAEKDRIISKMDRILNAAATPATPVVTNVKHKVKEFNRNVIFNQASLSSKEEIDIYLNNLKTKLYGYLNDCDEVKIK